MRNIMVIIEISHQGPHRTNIGIGILFITTIIDLTDISNIK
jgi:hypothetical protein